MQIADKNYLIFQGDNIDVSHTMPKKMNSKGTILVFLKKEPMVLTENIDSEVTFFEMGDNPLEHLEMICEAYLPIISNPLNQVNTGSKSCLTTCAHFMLFFAAA